MPPNSGPYMLDCKPEKFNFTHEYQLFTFSSANFQPLSHFFNHQKQHHLNAELVFFWKGEFDCPDTTCNCKPDYVDIPGADNLRRKKLHLLCSRSWQKNIFWTFFKHNLHDPSKKQTKDDTKCKAQNGKGIAVWHAKCWHPHQKENTTHTLGSHFHLDILMKNM